MLTSRNIHFAILGIIIGASAGYIFAFYEARDAAPAAITEQGQGFDHPPTNEAGLEELKAEVEKNPNDADALARYGTRLFTAGRIDEAIATYEKALVIQPENLTVRSLAVAMLFNQGNTARAKEHLDIAMKQNPNHIPTLHGLFLVTLEADHDVEKAAAIAKQIETLSPNYQGLSDLRSRLEQARKAPQP
jgi:tetratricopeptide (TPR) repeat protein